MLGRSMGGDSDHSHLAPGTMPTQPLAGEPLPPRPVVADRYRTVRWLGRGGMGSVYEVEDCELGIRVALKVAEGSRWDAATVAQLKREIQLARRVTHPNVCRVHDFGTHVLPDGTSVPFLTMELLEGRTLAAELAEAGRMDAGRVLEIAEAVAAALDAAHAVGVVHRDLKTGNVMITGSRTVVTDFGLAIDPTHDVTVGGALVGSPAYMAPEQVEGGAITVATDVYGFGVVLYELLTGSVPFRGETVVATAVQRLSTPPPPMREQLPDLPPRWEDVIRRCLRIAPRERFETCGDVVRELRSASLERAERASTRSPEQRSVALVLAQDVRDAEAFAAAIRGNGGTLLSAGASAEPRMMVGVFGAEHSLGDEIDRALGAAHAAADGVEHVTLSVGQATVRNGVVEGEALRDARAVSARRIGGVIASARTAMLIGTRCECVETEPGLFLVGPRRREASSTLVGRDAEQSILRRARDAVLSESRVLATWIVGPPGIGKSRLAEEAITLAHAAGMSVSSARALAHASRAYALFARPADAATEENRAARLIASDDTLEALSRSLSRGDDAQALSDRVRARVLARLHELAAAGPCAIVVDDLQWADPSSLALLSELPEVLGDRPVWLVLAARDELVEAEPELLEMFESAGRVEPSALRAADVAELVRGRLGRDVRPSIAQAIAERTGGNPLFVEQLVTLLDPSVLQADDIATWPLPASVEHAVQARFDRLPAAERECVKLLAVYGAATPQEVESLGGQREALTALARRGLATRAGAECAGAYRLRSPMLGEVVHRMIEDARRRELHRAAADVALARGRDAEEVARHLAAAGDVGAARAYARATLEHAARGDSRGVLRCAERAVELGVAPEHVFAVHFARAEAARFVAEPDVQRAFIREAARAACDDRERALAASEEGEWLRRNRRPDEAIVQLTRAIELARDGEAAARATARMASALITLGRVDEAAAALESVDARRLSAATRAILADVRGWLAGSTGDYGAVRDAYARAAALYAEAGDLRRAAGAESNRADAGNRLGRFDEAQTALRRALTLARKIGNRLTEGYALMNLGYALCESGDAQGASRVLDDALRLARSLGEPHLELGVRLYAARARLAGAVDVALARTIDALARDAAGDPTLDANARALAARAWLACGDVERACDAAEGALAIRDARRAIEEGEGDVFAAAVLAFEAGGRVEAARAVHERGRARVRELAARIADSAARVSFLERVSAHRLLIAETSAGSGD